MKNYNRVWAEININALRNNIINFRNFLSSDVRLCSIVKADAYGHGAARVSKAVEDLVDFFAVATLGEAAELLDAGISRPVLVLGYVDETEFEYAIKNSVRITVYDIKLLYKLDKAAENCKKKAIVHIKIDTGMGRLGFPCNQEGLDYVLETAGLEHIEIEGIFTHFYSSDEENKDDAYAQYEKFSGFTEAVCENNINIPIKHCANSAAAIDMPETHMNMVRLGISMYGLYPSEYVTGFKPEPVMSLKSHVIMVKTIKTGETVGYGASFTAKRPTVIATVSVGYADGYNRRLSNKRADIIIKGKRVPVAGRICMDMIMADVTDIEGICVGDEVVLVGKSRDAKITMEEVATLAGTVNYEFACGISKRVPRIYK